MKKRISSLLLVVGATAALTLPTTAHAAFEPGKFFSSLKDRVSNGAQRLYLRAMPGSKDAKAVLNQSTMAMEKVSTMNMDITFEGEAKQGGDSMGSAKINLNGPAELGDLYDPTTIKEHLMFSGEVQVEGVQISGAGEMIIDGTDAYYYKITELPMPLEQYSQLKNQWIKMDLTQLEEKDKPEFDAEFMKRYQEAAEKLYENATLSEARKEKWNGNNVFVIDMELDKDDLMTYIEDISDIMAEEMETETQELSAADKEQLEKVLEALTPMKATARVDRKTFYLRNVEMPFNINVQDFAEKVSGRKMTAREMGPNMPDEVNLKMNMSFDKFNEPVTITIPDDARPAEELMQEMMGGYYMGTPSYGSGYGSSYPSYPAQELPELTPAQQRQLQMYGY